MEVASDYQHSQRMLRQVAKTHKLKANTKKEIGRQPHHLSEQFASRRRFGRSHQTPCAVRHQARRYSSSGRPPSVEAVLARMEENGSGPDQATHAMGTGGTADSLEGTIVLLMFDTHLWLGAPGGKCHQTSPSARSPFQQTGKNPRWVWQSKP